jgi:hypothetical protein
MNDPKPERIIQREIVEFLKARRWHVERLFADAYQNGFPDLFAAHERWGLRWIEVKRPDDYSFTLRQRQKWPVWERVGIGIWILTAATQEQYDLLFKPPNWREFWKPSYRVPTREDIDAMLDEMDREYEREQQREQEREQEQST